VKGSKPVSYNLSNKINLINFPEGFYNDPTVFVPAKRVRVKTTVSSDEIADNVTTGSITKLAILVNPKFYGSDAPAIFPEGDSSFRNLQTIGFCSDWTNICNSIIKEIIWRLILTTNNS
jgi:hypothetical protein